jgi:prolipoprotein diacylglyceryltransferase
MVAYVAVFAFLWSIRKRPHADGTIFWWYLLLVPAARFVIEFWRINPTVAFDLSAAQLFSLALMAVGACGMLAVRGRAAARPEVAPAAPR